MKKIIFKVLPLFLVAIILAAFLSVSAKEEDFENTHTNTGDQRVDIVSIAKTQVGYMEGDNNDTKYGTWYGLPNQPWCAMFVSWCAREAEVPLDILRNCAIAAPDPGYFDIPFYDGEVYTPKQGDLFFTKTFSHVGLVDYVDGEYFYTVEGNTNDSGSSMGIGVFTLRRTLKDYYFGVPDYNYISKNHTCEKDVFVEYKEEHPHNAVYRCSVCAKLIDDLTDAGKVQGCVSCSIPEKPVLSFYNDTFLGDWAVTFDWKESDNATYYDFVLEAMSQNGEWQEYESALGVLGGFTWQLPEGRYRAQLTAFNARYKDEENPDGLYAQSGYKEFSVGKVAYTITYNLNDGSESKSVQTKYQGLPTMLSTEEPLREGYAFMGWSRDELAKRAEYVLGDLFSEDASVVLYAVWRDENSTLLLGDANEDEVVNIKDVTAIQKHLAGISFLSSEAESIADTDMNGAVNIKDATAIQKHLAGISTGLPIGEFM